MTYILSGKKTFFQRFTDGSFRTKWSGLWSLGKKFFDYFSVFVQDKDKWLSPYTTDDMNYYGSRAVHNYNINGEEISELLFVPENKKALVLVLEAEKAHDYEIEFAVNIRNISENWHERAYEIENKTKEKIFVSSIGALSIKSKPTGQIVETYYKEHNPMPGDRQRCLVVKYALKAKNAEIIFSLGDDKQEAMQNHNFDLAREMKKKIEYYNDLVRNSVSCNDKEIEQAFKWSIINLETLLKKTPAGYGYYAGYPWFQQIWGRDSGWVIPAIVDLGEFRKAKEALATLGKHMENGRIPNFITTDSKNIDYYSVDASLLWIISLHHYISQSDDMRFLIKQRPVMEKILSTYQKRTDKHGFIISDVEYEEEKRGETWMDTLNRSSEALDIQAMWIRSLECYNEMMHCLGRDSGLEKNVQKLRKNFDRKFWSGSFYYDSVEPVRDRKTANALVPLLFDLSKRAKDVLNVIESPLFTTPWGVRTLANDETAYNPESYHKGSVWELTTLWAACAEFKYGNPNKGLEYLKMISKDLFIYGLKEMTENWSADSGKALGCSSQTWNYALFIRAIDEYMLGIDINAFRKPAIKVKPRLPLGISKIVRKKRVKNKWFKIAAFRHGGEVKTEITDL